MKILSFDPGETTGVCIFNNPKEYKTLSIGKDFQSIHNIILETKPDLVVIEKFVLYPSKAKKLVWNEFYPSQIIGVIKFTCEKHKIPFIEQAAADKEYVNYLGHTFSNDHEKDAFGHAWFRYYTISSI